MDTENYFRNLEKGVRDIYFIAEEAKKKGLDPKENVEIPLAMSMAEKVVGLISTIYPQMNNSGIAKRITELEIEYGKLDTTIVFKIAEEVAKQKYCEFSSVLEAMDAGIRVGFAYTTLGVVSSPIEGFTGIKTRKTRDGKDYIEASFSGPIRSAGTTASCIVLILIDFLREMFGYSKYDPTEDEIKRVVTELTDFHERITNLQYMPTEEEMLFLAKNLPFQVAGDASEKLEVSNYKNLERVDTNYLRSGVCLILAEGLAQKAAKGFRLFNMARANGVSSTGFDFLKDYVELHEKRTVGKGKDGGPPTYIKDLVAGRPVYGHPSRSGAFRFRYGRGRVSGFSAASIHPSVMAITDDFIATGTQLKIEKPTKGCIVTPCDIIDGPIVKLKNGSVRKLDSKLDAKKLYKDVEEIIYLGDILFPYSDVVNRGSTLLKPGYVEEWWKLDLREKSLLIEKDLDCFDISFEQAIDLSREFKIPLHPKYIFYWTEISKEQFLGLILWIKHSKISNKLVLPWGKEDQLKYSLGKRALELIGVPHEITLENVVLNKENSLALFSNLGLDLSLINNNNFYLSNFIDSEKYNFEKSVLETINILSEFEIKDKAGDFIGTRMGRPEKAKLRKLQGSPNILFPVGNEGGKLRSVQEAINVGKVRNTFPNFYCAKCDKETIFPKCEVCGEKTKLRYYCSECQEKFDQPCEAHEKGSPTSFRDLDIGHYFKNAYKKIGMIKSDVAPLIKGIRGLSTDSKIPEHLAKGILRAKYDLQVNKDGTIRMDATEIPLISFKPKEIGTSIEKLKELGYKEDIYGKEIVSDEQIITLMPHDVLIPSSPETPDEKGEDVFRKICNFVDDELELFYGLSRFHNVSKKEDIIGQFGVCMAPHNCAGVVCRFIGFSNTLGLLASPYMHAAIRRDCDGDEAAIMLLTDVLINFSRDFLPNHRGGTQDAPLVLNARIDAGEVDDQILDFEMIPDNEYPLELYQLAEKREHSSKVNIPIVKTLLKEGKNPFLNYGFTHDTNNFNDGVVCSAYKTLGTMQEKVAHQMNLVEKIRAADTSDTARLIIERHFIRDIRGNLRKFSMQGFRCVSCNEILRRPPLSGVCPKCRGKIIFTIHEGGIKKYLDPALDLIKKYDLSPYIKQSIELTKRYIDSVFGKELEKQEQLAQWF